MGADEITLEELHGVVETVLGAEEGEETGRAATAPGRRC